MCLVPQIIIYYLYVYHTQFVRRSMTDRKDLLNQTFCIYPKYIINTFFISWKHNT